MPSHGPWLALASCRRVRGPLPAGGGEALEVGRPEQVGRLGPLAGLVDLGGRPPQVADLPCREEQADLHEAETELVEQVPLPAQHRSQLIHGATPASSGSIGRRSRGVSGCEQSSQNGTVRHIGPVSTPLILCNHVSMTSAAGTARLTAWFAGRIPDGWFIAPVEVAVDREEILVTGELAEPSVERRGRRGGGGHPRDRGPGPDRGVPGGHPGPARPHRRGGRGPLRQEGVVGRSLRGHRGGRSRPPASR